MEIPRFDLRALRLFVAVVETGSTAAAARRLHVAQPSISRQIRALEDRLGTVLFNRADGRLTLTPAGLRLLPLAKDLLARAASLASELTEEPMADHAITLVAPITTLFDLITPFLAYSYSGRPVVIPREAGPADVFNVVAYGDADVAIGAARPALGRFRAELISRPAVWAYVPPGHRWQSRNWVTVDELVDESLVVLSPEHATRRAFDDALAGRGLEQQAPVVVTNLSVAALAMAAVGHGVAVVSDEPIFDLHRCAILSGDEPLLLSLYAMWDPRRVTAVFVEAFVRELVVYCKQTREVPTAR